MQVQTKLASPADDAAARPDVHPKAANVDITASGAARERPRAPKGGERVDTATGSVGGGEPGNSNSGRNPGSDDILLAAVAKKRRTQSRIESVRKEVLSHGERLWIERLRLKEDQHAAAKRVGLTRWQYQAIERFGTELPKVMKIEPHEWCRIMRRRSGKRQREIAEELKVHRVWVHKMESGLENCDPLIWYWEQ